MINRSEPTTQTLVFQGTDRVELLGVRLKVRGALEGCALRLGETTLGTDPSCDLVLRDPAVSRRHCVVTLDDLGIRVRDLDSKNGTWVGSTRVSAAWMEPNQLLQLGDTQLVLEVDGGRSELQLAATGQFGSVLGASLPMRALFGLLERAAKSDTTVLFLGETGTGKDALARALHAASGRRQGPFVVCDCAGLPADLAEAELFGHLEGAFTGAVADRDGLLRAAHGGTLFIDEIGELPSNLQPKLLRALETRRVRPVGSTEEVPFDARLLAATHRDLKRAAAAGQFRQDLYYRLAVLEVRVPPLRERRDDIPQLVEHFLSSLRPPLTLADLPPYALSLLRSYDWPGNVRELRNVVERLAVTRQLGDVAVPTEPIRPWNEARAEALVRFELDYLRRALAHSKGSLAGAARLLGVSRQLIHRMVTRHGLQPKCE